MIQYIEFVGLGFMFLVLLVFVIVVACFGAGLIRLAIKGRLTLSDLTDKDYWFAPPTYYHDDLIATLVEGGKVLVAVCIVGIILFALLLIGMGVAHAQVARPTPDEVRLWMRDAGSTYDDAVQQDGAVFVYYKGGMFGGNQVSSFCFVFYNPRTAHAVMITFPGPLSREVCDRDLKVLNAAAEEVTKFPGKKTRLSAGQEATQYLLQECTVTVTSMPASGGWFPQYIIVWGN